MDRNQLQVLIIILVGVAIFFVIYLISSNQVYAPENTSYITDTGDEINYVKIDSIRKYEWPYSETIGNMYYIVFGGHAYMTNGNLDHLTHLESCSHKDHKKICP